MFNFILSTREANQQVKKETERKEREGGKGRREGRKGEGGGGPVPAQSLPRPALLLSRPVAGLDGGLWSLEPGGAGQTAAMRPRNTRAEGRQDGGDSPRVAPGVQGPGGPGGAPASQGGVLGERKRRMQVGRGAPERDTSPRPDLSRPESSQKRPFLAGEPGGPAKCRRGFHNRRRWLKTSPSTSRRGRPPKPRVLGRVAQAWPEPANPRGPRSRGRRMFAQ